MVRPPVSARRRYKKTGRTHFKKKRRTNSAPLATRGFTFPIPEKKYRDQTVFGWGANTTGSFTLLNAMVLGTAYNDRIGRRIQIKSVYIRGIVGAEAALTTISSPIVSPAFLTRCIVFVDEQPNGAAPGITDLLFEATACSQLNPVYRDRFRVLADKQYAIGRMIYDTTNGVGAADNCQWPVKIYKKCNITTTYNAGSAGTVGDIATGALYMFWCGSEPAGTDVDGTALVSARIRFYDN